MRTFDSLLASFVTILAGAAWGTGIVSCILGAKWLLLVACLFLPPVSMVYGAGVWMGVW